MKENISKMLDAAYLGSYYTITGCGGDLNDWINGYEKLLREQNIGKPKEWLHFTGKDMNEKYGLTGKNRYANDLNFLAFPIEELNDGIIKFKMQMVKKWLLRK
ncbi:MAG: hypothetical protein J6S67_25690 [Methanobrevibacter sp.]|nr:hypothetical protein [Methanobrevibacter sp.]